eukprot:1189095-Pleurochrysis_carterae.AAC.1
MRTEGKHTIFIGYEHGGKLKRPGRLSRALVMRWASKSGSVAAHSAVLRNEGSDAAHFATRSHVLDVSQARGSAQ